MQCKQKRILNAQSWTFWGFIEKYFFIFPKIDFVILSLPLQISYPWTYSSLNEWSDIIYHVSYFSHSFLAYSLLLSQILCKMGILLWICTQDLEANYRNNAFEKHLCHKMWIKWNTIKFVRHYKRTEIAPKQRLVCAMHDNWHDVEWQGHNIRKGFVSRYRSVYVPVNEF